MDRQLLNFFLRSGPSRRFDVLTMTNRIAREEQGSQFLFDMGFLNKSILFKYMELGGAERASSLSTEPVNPIRTLVYYPYDADRPGEGGESFVYSEPNLKEFCDYHFASKTDPVHFEQDIDRMRVIDSIPTLNPFLLKEAFERANVPIPEAYLDLDPESHAQLKQRVRARVRPLILAAFERSTGKINSAIDELCELFLKPNDIGAMMPLIQAMRIPPENAAEILSSWAGITYFEEEYGKIEPPLKQFAQWLAKYPLPREALTKEEKDFMQATCQKIRTQIRDEWQRSIQIIKEYRRTYNQLIHEHKAGEFIAFMNRSKEHYWSLGDLLGRLEQTNYAWRSYTANFPNQPLPYDRLTEFYEVLKQAHLAPIAGDALAA